MFLMAIRLPSFSAVTLRDSPIFSYGGFTLLDACCPATNHFRRLLLRGSSVAREVDETALDVGVDQLDVDAVAHVETLEPALQLPFGRRPEQPHPRSLRGGAGDDGVE